MTRRLQQASFPEIPQVPPGRLLDQIDRELEQTNFPRIIHPLQNRTQRLLRLGHGLPNPVDDLGQAAMDDRFLDLGFAKLEPVF